MTKILVCSDSHGNKERMSRLFEENNFDFFFFLGDGLGDVGVYENMPNVNLVRGNCDFFSTEDAMKIVKIENKTILATHGNSFGVKQGIGGLIKYAENVGADIVLFGHTHKFFAEQIGNIYYFNPGSLKDGSALLLSITSSDIKYEFLKI